MEAFMIFLLRLVIGVIAILVGILLMSKSYTVVQKIGYNDWAEEHLGGGGTFLLIKIIGMVTILLAVLLIFGIINPF